eukprot:1593769-Amphidinium_carterae.5
MALNFDDTTPSSLQLATNDKHSVGHESWAHVIANQVPTFPRQFHSIDVQRSLYVPAILAITTLQHMFAAQE